MSTLIEKIANFTIDDEKVSFDKTDFRKNSVDLFIPLNDRLSALIEYYHLEKESVGELIGSITGMYFFSRTKRVKEYLVGICSLTEIPIIYRIECAKNLEDDVGQEEILKLFEREEILISKEPAPVRVECVLYLMGSEKYSAKALEYFCNITSDTGLEDLYRFKVIQGLENKFKNNKKLFLFYARESSFRFLMNEKNFFTYRTIAGQYILEKCEPTEDNKCIVKEFLLSVAQKNDLDQNIRADACDILLQHGNESMIEISRNILFVIGGMENNIFKNGQNVHVLSIEESASKVIEKLGEYHSMFKRSWDFGTIKKELLETVDKKDLKALENALIRVHIDRATYGRTSMTLNTILVKIWTYICDSEFKEELVSILIDELVVSNNQCSTGYAERMVSVLSGFFGNDMNISYSFEDQMVANLEGRLNKKIRDLENEEFMELVILEMIIPVHHFSKRTNFLKFFRECISFIREEMYQEFGVHMDDSDFDLYFRKAIIHYEGYNC